MSIFEKEEAAGQGSAIIARLCRKAPVIPVLVIEEKRHAQPLAEALIAGGLPVLEVTLRTSAALEAIRAMAEVPGGIIGAGTLLSEADMRAAEAAGARFGVSPGATPALLNAAENSDLPLLPGAATASESMALLERGYTVQKFFPARASGGPAALRALGGPLPQITWCPTGGISAESAPEWLALKHVACIGGSWVAPRDLVAAENWPAITKLARAASTL